MDNLLTKIREIFAVGIQSSPGYLIGDGIRMGIDTKREINDLPETEGEVNGA